MIFSIILTEEEKRLADSYAKIHSMSLGEAFKRALFEKIEDEYDVNIADEAYQEYVADGKKSRPIKELWKEYDMWDTTLKPLLASIRNLRSSTNTQKATYIKDNIIDTK